MKWRAKHRKGEKRKRLFFELCEKSGVDMDDNDTPYEIHEPAECRADDELMHIFGDSVEDAFVDDEEEEDPMKFGYGDSYSRRSRGSPDSCDFWTRHSKSASFPGYGQRDSMCSQSYTGEQHSNDALYQCHRSGITCDFPEYDGAHSVPLEPDMSFCGFQVADDFESYSSQKDRGQNPSSSSFICGCPQFSDSMSLSARLDFLWKQKNIKLLPNTQLCAQHLEDDKSPASRVVVAFNGIGKNLEMLKTVLVEMNDFLGTPAIAPWDATLRIRGSGRKDAPRTGRKVCARIDMPFTVLVADPSFRAVTVTYLRARLLGLPVVVEEWLFQSSQNKDFIPTDEYDISKYGSLMPSVPEESKRLLSGKICAVHPSVVADSNIIAYMRLILACGGTLATTYGQRIDLIICSGQAMRLCSKYQEEFALLFGTNYGEDAYIGYQRLRVSIVRGHMVSIVEYQTKKLSKREKKKKLPALMSKRRKQKTNKTGISKRKKILLASGEDVDGMKIPSKPVQRRITSYFGGSSTQQTDDLDSDSDLLGMVPLSGKKRKRRETDSGKTYVSAVLDCDALRTLKTFMEDIEPDDYELTRLVLVGAQEDGQTYVSQIIVPDHGKKRRVEL